MVYKSEEDYRVRLSNETSSDKLSKVQEKLDQENMIKLVPKHKPTDFVDLLYKLFYLKVPTIEHRLTLKGILTRAQQCSSGRRRSIVDFYLIQKFYLQNPLSLEQCKNLYLELPRSNPINESRNYRYFQESYGGKHFYCPTVKRSVFNYSGYLDMNEFVLKTLIKLTANYNVIFKE